MKPDLMSSVSIATVDLTRMIEVVNMVAVPGGGAFIFRGPIGCGKTQMNTANQRFQQSVDPDFGGCLMNLANAESIDIRGLPQLDPLFSRYGMPPWQQPVPEMGLRGAFPALCPEHLRGDASTWGDPADPTSVAYAYATAADQIASRKLIPYKRGIVVLDECLQVIEETVLLSLAQLFDEHRVGEWGVPLEGWAIIGLTNRATDQAAVRELYAHVRNRIGVFDVTNDPDAVDDFWTSKGMNDCFKWFARAEPQAVFADTVPASGQEQFCSARAWEKAHNDVVSWLMNVDNVPLEELTNYRIPHDHAMVPALVAARCGTATALGFQDYLRNLEYLPDFADIIKSPTTAKLPGVSAVIYAVVEMMVEKATVQNLDKICLYVRRPDMPDTMKSVFCQRLARRMQVQTLFKHAGFMALIDVAGGGARQLLFGAEYDTGA